MKILHIVDSEGYYGAEVMIVTLALEQLKQGDHPIVCGTVRPGQEESEIVIRARAVGLQSVTLSLSGDYWHQSGEIYDYARSCAVELIHSHGYRPGILLGLQSGNSKVTKIRTLHGWTHVSAFSKMAIYSLFDALLLRRQDAVVVVSNQMRDLPLLRLVPRRLISYIANGIPVVASIPKTIDDLGDEKWRQLCRDCFVIGSIGRLSAEKAQADMLYAVARLHNKGLKIALIIIGEGDERQRLEQLAVELGIEGYVHLPGYKEDAASYMPLFDLFCLSSRTEGLPMTLLEAMRQKIPVLSTNVGAIPELLTDGRGYLISPGDIDEMSTTIKSVIEVPDQARIATEVAYDLFNNNYNSEIMADRYKEIYCSAMAARV